ncbi:hypothetical protein [Clostridium sp. ZS2-4]|uniref:hypothetical protein n=1 Tax=Clostridium sp. ZS2-4 TaxID=2987703 RepID=UPI00227D0031|nr:hypothetical protein [Clostridium sp. ZS2-4]MCY6356331.1 hypothetical protein [Clostridium sp. ZS2-4]
MREILVIIINLIIACIIYNELNLYRNTKEIIMYLRKTKNIRFLFSVQYIIVSMFIVIAINKIKIDVQSNIIIWKDIKIYLFVFLVAMLISYFIKYKRNMGITEEGIICYKGFFRWSNINSYEWTSSTTIKIMIKETFLFWKVKSFIELGVFVEEDKKIDDLLQKYIS